MYRGFFTLFVLVAALFGSWWFALGSLVVGIGVFDDYLEGLFIASILDAWFIPSGLGLFDSGFLYAPIAATVFLFMQFARARLSIPYW